MSDYKSNYGIDQLTPEYLSSLMNSDCFGPAITKNGKYYITTLNPNVDILSIPEQLSYDPKADNYYGKYYGITLVLDQTTSTEDARKLVDGAYGKWCNAYDSNFTMPYQIDKSSEEIDRYISEAESTIGCSIERFEMGDSYPTIWYRDKDGNLVDQQVEIKLNPNVNKQVKEIKDYYQNIYGKDKKVDVVKNKDGSYSLTVDGKEVKKFSLNKYDMSSLESATGTNKVKSSDKLNDGNKSYLEEFYKESFKDKEVKVKKNADGTYSLIVGDEYQVDFKKGTTIAEAIAQANEEINSGKALKTPNKGQNTRRLNDLTGQGYKIYINVNDFENVQSSHNMAKGIIEGAADIYRTDMFTEKLADAYSSIVAANEDPTKRITKSNELLSNIVTNVHYSLEAYKNIDHDLGIVINSVIEEIFSINSYENKHSELSGLSQNEKEEKIKEMIKYLDTNIKDLQKEYKKYYDNGFGAPLTENFAQFLVGLADAFSLDSTQKDAKYYADNDRYSKDGTVRLDFDQIETTIKFIKDNNVINKLGSYAGTKDQGSKIARDAWEKSGMADLNKYILANSNVSDYTKEQKNDYAERLFLTKFINSQGEFKNEFSKKYGVDPRNYLLDEGLWGNNDPDSYYKARADLINDIKGLISTRLSEKVTVKTYELADDKQSNIVRKFNVFELADYYTSDGFKQAKKELNDSILDLQNTKYNYERYLEVLPYLHEKDNPEYLKYLTKDFSKYDLHNDEIANKVQYLNQEEIALYMMLKESGNGEKAGKYLESMSDLIAQREGFQLAAERIYEMNKNGQDIWDFINTGGNGFTDGLEGFFRNIGNCFSSDGKRDAIDYRNMFMVSLLSEDSIYNDKLSPEYRDILKRNYTVMSSVGNMLIPAISRFIPYVGWAASPALLAMGSYGSSVESAKQMGKSDVQAYLYGGFQACSTLVLYRVMSGIPGIGNGKVPKNWLGFASNLGQAAERSVISTYLDATLRATILQEPVDFSHLHEQALDQALNAMFVSAVMQTGTKITLKIADGITIKLSGGEYNSYQEFLADTEAQFKATPMGQRLLKLYSMDADAWKEYKGHNKGSIVPKLVEEMKDEKSEAPLNLTDKAEECIGMKLESYERLMFDRNAGKNGTYYIVDLRTGGGMSVPGDWLSNHEPGAIGNVQANGSLGSNIGSGGVVIADASGNLLTTLPNDTVTVYGDNLNSWNDGLDTIIPSENITNNEQAPVSTGSPTDMVGTTPETPVIPNESLPSTLLKAELPYYSPITDERVYNVHNTIGGPGKSIGEKEDNALLLKPGYIYRGISLDNIDDIAETGYVRAGGNMVRQKKALRGHGYWRSWWKKGGENSFEHPPSEGQDGGAWLEIPESDMNEYGAVPLSKLSGIYTFNRETGQYENNLEKVQEQYQDISNRRAPTPETIVMPEIATIKGTDGSNNTDSAPSTIVTLQTDTAGSNVPDAQNVLVAAGNLSNQDVVITPTQQTLDPRITEAEHRVHEGFTPGHSEDYPGSFLTDPDHVYRLTGSDQIEDVEQSGYVRPKAMESSKRQMRIGKPTDWWSQGGEKYFIKPGESKSILVAPTDKVKGIKGAIPIKDLTGIYTYNFNTGQFEDHLSEVLDKNAQLLEAGVQKTIQQVDTPEEDNSPKPENQLISTDNGKYVIKTKEGEEYTMRSIGVKHDALGSSYGGVTSTFDGIFTENDNVQLEAGMDDHRFTTIGDVSEAKEILKSVEKLVEPETLQEKCSVVGETVNEYFGDFQLYHTRLNYFPTDEDVELGATQGKVSDLAHGQAAACVERAMLSQNLLKELGIDSTFKIAGFKNSVGNNDTHAFNIIKDDGKYYIFDATQPTLRNGVINPLICELPEEVALKMLDPLSHDGTGVKVTHFNPLQQKDYTVTYDAGWKDVYEATCDCDDGNMFNISGYRVNLMSELGDYLEGDNVEQKEAADMLFKSYVLSDPVEATSYFRKQFSQLLPSTQEELLDKALSSPRYYQLLHYMDLSPDGTLYQEDKEGTLRIYGELLKKFESGEYNYRNMENVAPYVFKELDPIFPVKADINDAAISVIHDPKYYYLRNYTKEIIDYTVENNVPINNYVVYNLIGPELIDDTSDGLIKILDAGNYDSSGYDAMEYLIKNNGENLMRVAKNHPEYLEGKTIKLFTDVDGFVEGTSNVKGIKYYYEAGRYDENIETLHEELGDKLLIRPKNNSWSGTVDYTYDEYMAKEGLIESYASSLYDKVDKNGNIKHLTPYEKYVASHIITSKFAVYNLPKDDPVDLSRSVYEFIDKTDNRPICCAGYVSMDNEILERQEYPDGSLDVIHWSVRAIGEGDKDATGNNHDRSLVHLVDPTYSIDGIYMSDPTWDHIFTSDLTKTDIRERSFSYLLKTQEDLSHAPRYQFEDPLKNMHIETDKDLLRVADNLKIFDSDAVKTVREKFNQPISDRDYIIALCAINRFVDKDAVMPQERTVGENGFSIEEYNRAALSAGLTEELIIPDEYYQKPAKDLVRLYQDELDLDEYGASSMLDTMFKRKVGYDKGVNIYYDSEDDVGAINLRYKILPDEDLKMIDNLPDDQWNFVTKAMNFKAVIYRTIDIEEFDGNTPFEDIINKDIDYVELATLKQAENHEKLMGIMASLEDTPTDTTPPVDQEEALKDVQVIINAMDDLDKIAKEKGMTLADLGKQKGEVDPVLQEQVDGLAQGLQEKAREKEPTVTELMKTYQDSEYEGISSNDLYKGVKDGSIKEYSVLMGLDHNIKGTDSLSGKILTDFNHHKYDTIDKCADDIHDTLRYTLVIDDAHYTDSVQSTIDNLRERGYLVTAKNLWGNKSYQGVNAVITDRNTGFSFELQFHTAESYYIDGFTHEYYEIFRNDCTTQEEKDLANIVRMGYEKKVPVPDGIIGHDFN